jgi:serine phosphatase RsbU (regulator of sigma subunit)
VSYAGHPRGWIYRAATRAWERLEAGEAPSRVGPLVDLPLATGLSPAFARRKLRAGLGDRVLLVTDGVLEASSPAGDEFGAAGVARVLDEHGGRCEDVGQALLDALITHTESARLTHDDVTFFLGEIVAGPAGWVRHRLLGWWR